VSQRTERVDELLRQEIGALLSKEVADPRIGFATITDVETSPDLRHAKVWVSVIGEKGDRDDTLRALRSAMPFIRHELGKRLRIKRIPELHVHLDDTAGRATRVLHLLDELERGVLARDRCMEHGHVDARIAPDLGAVEQGVRHPPRIDQRGGGGGGDAREDLLAGDPWGRDPHAVGRAQQADRARRRAEQTRDHAG